LQALGCKDALNMDGGASTTMYIKGEGVVNEPVCVVVVKFMGHHVGGGMKFN
jgi:exopolysaccharide biosynthesis protein